MTTFVLPADTVHESAAVCDYVVDRLEVGDTVHAVSSEIESDPQAASRDSEDAQNAIYARLSATAAVDRHTERAETQPAALLGVAERTGADEIVVSETPDKRDLGQLVADSPAPVVVVPGGVD